MSDGVRPDGHLEHVVPLITPVTPLPALSLIHI